MAKESNQVTHESVEQLKRRFKESDLHTIVPSIAKSISVLSPGLLAELRRGPLDGGGSAAFWRLMAKFQVPKDLERKWAGLIQSIAILIPKGDRSERKSPHNPTVGLGTVLYQANFSELRLARLLSARQDMRIELTIRACRRLAASNCHQLNLITLAKLVLFNDEEAEYRVAREYYRAEIRESAKNETSK